jgi:hypothetical protein
MTQANRAPIQTQKAIYEKHFHNVNLCYGSDGGTSLLQKSLVPFVVTSGAIDVFGTEVQIHDGTVISSGNSEHSFDIGRIYVTDVDSNNVVLLIELWYGTGTFGEASILSEQYFVVGSSFGQVIPIIFPVKEVTCNNKLWVRIKSSVATRTLSFLLEAHVYLWA